jgi:hypothetical protein
VRIFDILTSSLTADGVTLSIDCSSISTCSYQSADLLKQVAFFAIRDIFNGKHKRIKDPAASDKAGLSEEIEFFFLKGDTESHAALTKFFSGAGAVLSRTKKDFERSKATKRPSREWLQGACSEYVARLCSASHDADPTSIR